MGSMEVGWMAVVATLAPLLVAAPEPESSSAKKEVVKCEKVDKPYEVTVSEPGTTVVVECQSPYTFDPKVNSTAEAQEVYTKVECNEPQPLKTVCPNVSITALNEKPVTSGATITVQMLPADEARTFFVQCKPESPGTRQDVDGKACKVQVTVNKASDGGPQDQTAGAGPPGNVHVCTPSARITVSVPAKDSSVQFQCAKPFNLYPTDPKRVFKDDCKTEENLKDMTRTHAPAATTTTGAGNQALDEAAQLVYTLRADKKPPKRRLCYLCAKQEAGDTNLGPKENYCAIYVESSARAQFDVVLTLAPMLWCALAVLQIT